MKLSELNPNDIEVVEELEQPETLKLSSLDPTEVETVDDNQSKPELFESAIRGAGQGLSLGFSDEIVGGLKAGVEKATDYVTGRDSVDLSNLYEKYRDLERTRNKEAEKENPYTYGSSELLGNVATAFVPGGQIGTIGKAAMLGGATGLGRSEADNVTSVARDTAKGALLGAGAYKAGSMLGKYLKPSTEKIGDALESTGRKIRTFASKPILNVVDNKPILGKAPFETSPIVKGVKGLGALGAGLASGGPWGAVGAKLVQGDVSKLTTPLEMKAVRAGGKLLQKTGNVLKDSVDEAMASVAGRIAPIKEKELNEVLSIDKYLYSNKPETRDQVLNILRDGGFNSQADALQKAYEDKDEQRQNSILFAVAQTPEARKLFTENVK